MAKWSEDTTIKFVSEYVVHECLWNIKNLAYKNKQARHSAYTALKEAMGIPGFDVNAVITKIKNIRSTYSQEVKKINDSMKSGAGADSIYKPNVKWFDILHDVLQSVNLENRKTQSNMNTIEDKENMEENQDARNYALVCIDDRPVSDLTRPSRKRNMRGLNSLLDKAKVVVSELNNARSMIEKEGTNEFELFGKSVGVHLNSMSLENALRAQSVIQTYLTNVRLQELKTCNRTSVVPTPSPSYVRTPSPSYLSTPSPSYVPTQTTSEHTSTQEAPTDSGQSSMSDIPHSELIVTNTPNISSDKAHFSHDAAINLDRGDLLDLSDQQTAAQQNNDTLSQAMTNIPMYTLNKIH
ncbi:uncharacterized protein LOC125061152 [Pieris napi]|uniref:uncharacterized protein LOC125061152 n=1 Tax=Pieris napi TaxID=78633 RepID=UPI001FBC0E6E|nr:uncharacterized protein LOC125061152 [Pieris napi]